MNSVVKFFHELINPHCHQCMEDELVKREESRIIEEIEQTLKVRELEQEQADKVCQSCENLKMQLSVMNQLVDKLTNEKKPEVEPVIEQPKTVIQTRMVPWQVTRQRLEAESRLKAEQLTAERAIKIPEPDKIKELEISMGIDNGPEAVNS